MKTASNIHTASRQPHSRRKTHKTTNRRATLASTTTVNWAAPLDSHRPLTRMITTNISKPFNFPNNSRVLHIPCTTHKNFSVQATTGNDKRHSNTSPSKTHLSNISDEQLLKRAQIIAEVNQHRSQLGKELLADDASEAIRPFIAYPNKGITVGPKAYELNPDEVLQKLMEPFLTGLNKEQPGLFTPNQYGQTSLHLSVLHQDAFALEQLLLTDVHEWCNTISKTIRSSDRVPQNIKDTLYTDDSTPENPSFAARYLISKRDKDGICPLFYSLTSPDINIPRMLLAHGAYTGYEYKIPIHDIDSKKTIFETKEDQQEKMEIDQNYTPKFSTHSLLTVAASMGKHALATMLLLSGANANQVLSTYDVYGYLDVVKEKIKTTNQNGITTVAKQIKSGHKSILEHEYARNPSDTADQTQKMGKTIDWEILENCLDYDSLLKHQHDNVDVAVSYVDKYQKIYNSSVNDENNVKPLIDHHHNSLKLYNQKYNQQKEQRPHSIPHYSQLTALTNAVLGEDATMVKLLLDLGHSDVQLSSYLYGEDLLEVASYIGNKEIIAVLLDHDAKSLGTSYRSELLSKL